MASSSAPTARSRSASQAVDDAGTDRMAGAVAAITGVRCVLMYMVLPSAGVIGSQLDGAWMPGAGMIAAEHSTLVLTTSLLLHAVTLVTTVLAVRRAFRSRHRLRWPYAMLGSTFFLFSVLSIVFEGAALLS